MYLAFPMMSLCSLALTVAGARGWRRGADIDTARADYLGYLVALRERVTEMAAAQRVSLIRTHPDPETLWTLIGGPRMWERRASESDFGVVRVGIGTQPTSARLVCPEMPHDEMSDPVTATALHRFVNTHSVLTDAPVTVDVLGTGTMTIDGDATLARGLLRAMTCQLAVLHAPDQLAIVGAVCDANRGHWEWLKWLPHNQHPAAADAVGSARMIYHDAADAQRALAGLGLPHVVVIADLDGRVDEIAGTTVLGVGTACRGGRLTISGGGEARALPCPDVLSPEEALTCARQLAMYRAGPAGPRDGAGLDLTVEWRRQERRRRLRVPLGTTIEGAAVELDIKEPAENGMGPHGLCVGATGSGKSELLRAIALGMMARNSPAVLNMLLIDFKGGATFLEFARAPHVAAVITNLAEEAPLVCRMRDALAGEIDRRQRLLRAAGCAGIKAYELARDAGGDLPALPTLFIIVDEFSELLSQHPDFADMFVAIGRLGRSLGMHLLLASQRLEEARLRGLEAHLSYRICLKTLSVSDSRAVLGTSDGYELPNTPGAGFLRSAGGELIRFQAAFVSGPLNAETPPHMRVPEARAVRVFSACPVGAVTPGGQSDDLPTRTVLQVVLDRMSGHGPPAHQVWLPPLDAAPPLDTLLRDAACAPDRLSVPIGIVDRPFEQSRTPLVVDLSGTAGNVAVVGAPQSGKSTALRTLITALAATHDPVRVQFYCLDFGGGSLASVRDLPHVGAVAGRNEPELVRRMVAEMESIVRSREADRAGQLAGGDRFADVFLVVDGWASLRQDFDGLEGSIISLAAQGLSSGMHVVLSASRWADIRPSLRDQIGTRIELRLGDPADSELDRKRARLVPHDRPGRGLSGDGLHMVIALPAGPPGDVARNHRSVAPPIPMLPVQVDLDELVQRAGAALRTGILLGLGERRLLPVPVDFEEHSHLLVLGDIGCGKTSTLRTLCREIVRTNTAAQAQLLIVDFRRALLDAVPSAHLGGYAAGPAALEALLQELLHVLRRRLPPADATPAQLRTGSWWAGPHLYVVVDDYDLVTAGPNNPLGAILEYLFQARDLGLHLIVARRGGGAERAMFEPLLAGLRDLGCLALMMSGRPTEVAVFGAGRPKPMPPGRGILVTRGGDEHVVQVAWSPPP